MGEDRFARLVELHGRIVDVINESGLGPEDVLVVLEIIKAVTMRVLLTAVGKKE
jgi:hypothetical protein